MRHLLEESGTSMSRVPSSQATSSVHVAGDSILTCSRITTQACACTYMYIIRRHAAQCLSTNVLLTEFDDANRGGFGITCSNHVWPTAYGLIPVKWVVTKKGLDWTSWKYIHKTKIMRELSRITHISTIQLIAIQRRTGLNVLTEHLAAGKYVKAIKKVLSDAIKSCSNSSRQ